MNEKMRISQINQALIKGVQGLYAMLKLPFSKGQTRYYAVILKKNAQELRARIADFWVLFNSLKLEGESVSVEEGKFLFHGEGFTLIFQIEGYKKRAEFTAFCTENGVETRLLGRMSAYQTMRLFAGFTQTEKGDTLRRLSVAEMVKAYPCTFRRFAESVKITQRLKKTGLSVRYTDVGQYGAEILFHVVNTEYTAWAGNPSVLHIEEDLATFLLPMVEEVYPYFNERYYLTENHLPWQAMRDIAKRVKAEKERFIRGDIRSFYQKNKGMLNQYVFTDNTDSVTEKKERELAFRCPVAFIKKHKKKIILLYDIFLRWLSCQLKTFLCYDYDLMFNIQGP